MSDGSKTYFQVTAACATGHSQTFRVYGMSREWVDGWAGLMDGTSPLYVSPPDEQSPIGKCGICGAKITCKVEEMEEFEV